MPACPNCGGALKFDIKSQAMLCESCASSFAPEEIESRLANGMSAEGSAEEETEEMGHVKGRRKDSMQVTVFHCPQCGGEIYSTDETVASFCSYCGASTVLESRISNEKKPDYILPFQKTKDDCKRAYRHKMIRAIYAPREIKSARYIDGFRGIYMPYWLYDMEKNGAYSMPSYSSYRMLDYIHKKNYSTSGCISAKYKGISYDASSSFDDEMSSGIAPFETKKLKRFSQAYLSGFYADSADVSENKYQEMARDFATEHTISTMVNMIHVPRKPDVTEDFEKSVKPIVTEVHRALYPVWFVAYRKKDRVAYATVNGETGKVAADIPISILRFIIGSLILAIPLYFLFNSFFTLLPTKIALLGAVISIITMGMYGNLENKINDREKRKRNGNIIIRKHKSYAEKYDFSNVKNAIWLIAFFSTVVAIFLYTSFDEIVAFSNRRIFDYVVSFIILIIACFKLVSSIEKPTKRKKKRNKLNQILINAKGKKWPFLGVLLVVIVEFIHPANDIFYYIAFIVSLILIFLCLVSLIQQYNIFTTHPLPQFKSHKGGDDRA